MGLQPKPLEHASPLDEEADIEARKAREAMGEGGSAVRQEAKPRLHPLHRHLSRRLRRSRLRWPRFHWFARRSTRFKLLFVTGAICALLVIFNLGKQALFGFFMSHMPPQVATISATEVVASSWTPGIEAVGTAKAVRGVDIAAEAGGVVTAINFKANDLATAGQVLVQIDDAVERADLIAAEANIKLYENQLARQMELRRKGVSSQASLDDARAQLDVAKSTYARLTAILDQKALMAPFDGVVGIPLVDVGEYVTPGTVVVTIQDLSRIRVDFTVPEQSAHLIQVGQPTHFSVDQGAPAYQGQVTGIDPKVDPGTRLVAVQAELDNAGGRILPGQFLRVRVDRPVQRDVITLPQTAVVSSLYGDFVYVVEAPTGELAEDARKAAKRQPNGQMPSAVRQVYVTVGAREQGLVVIEKGLKPSQKVVTAGQNKLQNNGLVVINNTIDPARLVRTGAEATQ
jgi:membrane fusion protein (multidrug efflux system)